MREQMKQIIEAHNELVNKIMEIDFTVNLFKGMEVLHKLAVEGSKITHTARENGIDCKIDMQSGVITIYGDL